MALVEHDPASHGPLTARGALSTGNEVGAPKRCGQNVHTAAATRPASTRSMATTSSVNDRSAATFGRYSATPPETCRGFDTRVPRRYFFPCGSTSPASACCHVTVPDRTGVIGIPEPGVGGITGGLITGMVLVG